MIAWMLLGCAASGTIVGDDPSDSAPMVDDTGTAAPADFRLTGPTAWTASTGQVRTSSGCVLTYDRRTPAGGGPLVILSHGLQRRAAQQADLSAHLASWGFDVVTPNLCTSTVLDIDQEKNGRELTELRASFGVPAIYAGHSAGGLASLVAASLDAQAVAFVGLDAVDKGSIGADAAAALAVPLLDLVGDPGACNANGNLVPVLRAVEATAVRVVDADHCDFESPTDWVCTLPCGESPTDVFSDTEIRATAFGMVTAAAAWQTGLDPSGAAWWTAGGAAYETARAEGAIAPL